MANKKIIYDERVTMLSALSSCAYKAANTEYSPDPSNTYHGDLMNIAATSSLQDPLSDYGYFKSKVMEWKRTIKPSATMKDVEMMLKLMIDTNIYVNELRKKYNTTQEQKMYILYKETDESKYFINGTADIVYYNSDIGLWCVEDLKCSTHSYYTGDDMRDYNMQTWIYPMMVMMIEKVTKVGFRYRIGDKNSGKSKFEPQEKPGVAITEDNYVIRTLPSVSDHLSDHMENVYIPFKTLGIAEANRNKLCMFCELKNTTCPLKSSFSVTMTPTDDDDDL